MEYESSKKVAISLPKDKSLDAYKVWVTGIAKRLTKTETLFSEKEWIEGWKDFWKGQRRN
jgi:hypothetical protein